MKEKIKSKFEGSEEGRLLQSEKIPSFMTSATDKNASKVGK